MEYLLSHKENYNRFIDLCKAPKKGYRLTPRSEVSPYALCFAIFGKYLINRMDTIESEKVFLDEMLRKNLKNYRRICISKTIDLTSNKAYLQLLCFTLSALWILGTLIDDPLEAYVNEIIVDIDILDKLKRLGVFDGKPGSGNFAMFFAILLIHSKEYLNNDTGEKLDSWCKTHLEKMNAFGFWGKQKTFSYSQFQNGYHQYEIFEYLGVNLPNLGKTVRYVASLVDKRGHFAPYPGGGGCYDYDAISILTHGNTVLGMKEVSIIEKTRKTILSEQNPDGGFAESHFIRPLNAKNLKEMFIHLIGSSERGRRERARYCLTLLRPKHDRIKTHWTKYRRRWYESNLWDSWFRMLTVMRVRYVLDDKVEAERRFIDYPGIGYHHSLNGQ